MLQAAFFFSSRRRHTRYWRDWSSDVCSSDLEIERLAPQHPLQLVVGARRVMGDAEVADAAGLLPVPQGAEVGSPVEQVVDLHQVEAPAPEAPQRLLHLGDTGVAPGRPDLGGEKEC